jgi:hypothetical protein
MTTETTTPAPGDGATVRYYTDQHAATVTRVSPSGKTVWVREDKATRVDGNGMSECQDYTYSPDPTAPERKFTLRSNGLYRKSGTRTGCVLYVGARRAYYRRAYYDYSF